MVKVQQARHREHRKLRKKKKKKNWEKGKLVTESIYMRPEPRNFARYIVEVCSREDIVICHIVLISYGLFLFFIFYFLFIIK